MSAPSATGLYLHWPYCEKICPYCDFFVARERAMDWPAWERALLEDIDAWADRLGPRSVVSVYFGGGTPSRMKPSLVGAVLERVAKRFDIAPSAEITLEANPTDAEINLFDAFAAVGINRLSLGLQSFDDRHLAFLGRNHTGKSAMLALERALACFGSVSADQIYALPDETLREWEARLRRMCDEGISHLSLYQLTVEPQTAFQKAVLRGDWEPVVEARAADLYEVTQSITEAAGLPGYEISNHARPGQQAVHNGLYWDGADWIGLGPGAHGRLTIDGERVASAGITSIPDYLAGSFSARYTDEKLSTEASVIERLSGGLRRFSGLPLTALPAEYSRRLEGRIAELVEEGFLETTQDRLLISRKGRLVADGVIQQLVDCL